MSGGRAALIGGLALVAGGAGVTVDAKPGRIVRVEKSPPGPRTPGWCTVNSGNTAICYGPEPQKHAIITVLDESAPTTELRVEEVIPATDGCTTVWNVRTTIATGTFDRRSLGVTGLPVGPGGHLVSSDLPSPDTGVVNLAIDTDGDEVADLLVTRPVCAVQPQDTCYAIYVIDRAGPRVGSPRYRLASSLNIASCMT